MTPRQLLQRHWFLLGISLAILAGVLLPGGGDALRNTGVALPLLVGLTMLISGFTLDMSRLLKQTANVRAIVLTLATTYVVAPALAYMLAWLWAPPIDGPRSEGAYFLPAVMIAAAQAGTLASALALTVIARGNQELALILTVLSNAVTALLTPIVLRISIGEVVEFPVGAMMGRMALVVVLPIFIGQGLRRLLRGRADRALPVIAIVPRLIILVFLYAGFSAAAGHLVDEPLLAARFLAATATLHVALLGWSYSAATVLRFSTATRAAVVLCGSQKTLPNGIFLWERYFHANPYGAVPLVLYHVFQLVVDALIVPWISAEKESEG